MKVVRLKPLLKLLAIFVTIIFCSFFVLFCFFWGGGKENVCLTKKI